MTIQVRESGALRFPALAMRGAAASAIDFDALEAEIIAAREGEASLDAKLDIMEAAAQATTDEVIAARSGSASLDVRIDGIANEIAAAREGEASLDAKLDIMEAATQIVFDEVVTARSGSASLDVRIDAIAATADGAASGADLDALEAEIIAARGGEASLDARLDDMTADVASGSMTPAERTKLAGIEALADVTDAASVGAAITGTALKATLADADTFAITDSAASFALKETTWATVKSEGFAGFGVRIVNGTGKTVPVGADSLVIADSEATNATKKLSLTNLWAAGFTGLGAHIANATGKSLAVAADAFVIADSEAASATRKLTLTNFWASAGSLVAALNLKATPVDADKFMLADSEAANTTRHVTYQALVGTVFSGFGIRISNAAGKATPADADLLVIADSEAAFVTKKLTLANLLVWAFGDLGERIANASGKTSLVAADAFVVADSAAANGTKKVTWGNLAATPAETAALTEPGKLVTPYGLSGVITDLTNSVPDIRDSRRLADSMNELQDYYGKVAAPIEDVLATQQTGGNVEFALPRYVEEAEYIDGVRVFAGDPLGTAVNFQVRLWLAADGIDPGTQDESHLINAELLYTQSQFKSLLITGTANGWMDIVFTTPVLVPAGRWVFAAVRALNGASAEVDIGWGRANLTSDAPVLMGGFHRNTGAAANGWTDTLPPAPAGWLLARRVDLDLARVGSLESVDVGRAVVGSPPAANYWGTTSSDNFHRWIIGGNPPGPLARPGVRLWLVLDEAEIIDLRIWLRPLARGDITSPGLSFPGDAGDVQVFQQEYIVANLGVETVGTPQQVELPISSSFPIDHSSIVFIDVRGFADDGTTKVKLGIANTGVAAAEPNWSSGAYEQVSGGTGVTATKIAAQLIDFVADAPVAVGMRQASTEAGTTQEADFAVTIDAHVLTGADGDLVVPAQTYSTSAITASPQAETVTMRAGADVMLPHRFLSGTIEVRRDSDLVLLTEGTDYNLYREQGTLYGLTGGTLAVQIEYEAGPLRYDLIHADRITGEVGRTPGTSRNTDPEEYLPALPAGKLPLYSAFVSTQGVERIPLAKWRGFQRQGDLDYQALKEWNRERTPNLHRAMSDGVTCKIVFYGDSITATGSITPAQQLTPNSAGHNLITGYFEGMEADTLSAKVPTYLDSGATETPTGAYHRSAWHHEVSRQLRARGAVVTNLNMGVGGTTSANSMNGGTTYNGGHDTRLDAVEAQGARAVFVMFGMNELGSASTHANMRDIIARLKGTLEVVVVGCPMTSTWARNYALAAWSITEQANMDAAIAENVAYVPLGMLTRPGREGGMRLSRQSLCSAGRLNHPGPYEHARYGQLCAAMII